MIAMPNRRTQVVTPDGEMQKDWVAFLDALRRAVPDAPFADDEAAAAGGVPVGGMYRRADGVLAWRVS